MSDVIEEDMISLYSREDAIRDGVLISVDPGICKEAGIRFPVAITDHLWGYVSPDTLDVMPGQSVTGRLWDLLWMFAQAARRGSGGDRLRFKIVFLMLAADRVLPHTEVVTVLAVCGPGDEGEPVITLMLPEDD